MKTTPRSLHPLARICLAASLGLACAPTTGAVPPAASVVRETRSQPGAPRASVTVDADDPNIVGVASRIRRVSVYSDRALVTREGKVRVGEAPTVVAFRQLPGWVDESSVRAAISAGRILDVQVVRHYLARTTDPRYLRAEAASRGVKARVAELDDELKVLDAQAKQIEDIKSFSLAKLDKDVLNAPAPAPTTAPSSVGVGTYSAVVDFIAKKLREIAKGRRDVQTERESLLPQVEASKKQLDELRALTQVEETQVLVTLQGTAAADAQLELSYSLPGATWESVHELRAGGPEQESVELTSYAVVTQATGEDWDDATLTFSTQSSTATVRIPALEALTLGDTRAAVQTFETRSASFKRAEAAFQGQNRLWNKHLQRKSASESFEESYESNFESLQVTQSKTVQIFQSLQQRGTTTQFKALASANVRADGRSVRVPIGRTTMKAKRAIVAAPEQSLNAAQTLELANDSGQSLLPGNVALYQGGAFLGMTDVGFVADGEQFSLFMSVADQLKLTRVLDRKRSALVRKQRTQMQLAFVVTVENLSGKSMPLELADRVPVSEDKDIIISGVKVSPDAKPDSKGILRFSMTIKPREKRRIEVQYQIDYPPTLVVEMKRNALQPASSPAPAAADPYDLRRDIQRLESF